MADTYECWRKWVVRPADDPRDGEVWWVVHDHMVDSLKAELYLAGCRYKKINDRGKIIESITWNYVPTLLYQDGVAELFTPAYERIRESYGQ